MYLRGIVVAWAICGVVGGATAVAQGPVPRVPDYEAMRNADEDPQNREAVKRLESEQRSKYFRGAENFEEVKSNMRRLQQPILLDGGNPDFSKWYSPHLRDTLFTYAERALILPFRAMAGASWMQYIWLGDCYICLNGLGTPQTACTTCQPKGSVQGARGCWWWPGRWLDDHVTPTCCRKNTISYMTRFTDSNFKTCGVLEDDKRESTEEVACRRPNGSGWSGLFEYYYPTAMVGWENGRTTTMIASKEEVQQCLGQSKPLMRGENAAAWVAEAIQKNSEVAEKLGTPGPPPDAADLRQKIDESLQAASDVKEDNQVTDSLEGMGLTMRHNFITMAAEYRTMLATKFCMRPEQFLKLMNPGPNADTLQKGGGLSETLFKPPLYPIWSNYCPEGVQLMTNPEETNKCANVDSTDTDFLAGMMAWDKDPLFCQRMNLQNPAMQEYFGEVLSKSPGALVSEKEAGFTCRAGGKLNGSMVPVELYRHAPVERRAALDHVLAFAIAGGLYEGKMITGNQSFYKRFEPRPYSRKFGMFVGKPYYGSGSGPVNELDEPCSPITPEIYQGQDMSDQLFISEVTHPKKAFTDKEEIINSRTPMEFNRSVEEWAKPGLGKTMPNRAVDDEKDATTANYAVLFRIFATLPLGHTRWRPKDVHDAYVAARCGQENFGGLMPPDPR
jgi:hypothetical protein